MKRCYVIMVMSMLFGVVFPVWANDCNKAIEIYNQATRSDQPAAKERLFKQALTLACKSIEVQANIHNNLADTYEKQGRAQAAIEEYKTALKLEPGLATAAFSLGDIYFKEENYPYAIKYYEGGLKIKKDDLAEANLKKARRKVPLYQSKDQLIAKLHISRGIRVVPKAALNFEFNASELSPQSERQLEALLGALHSAALNTYRFRLSGHTCNQGGETYNQALSERRSEMVKEWLVRNGFPAHQLQAVGYGESRPIAENTTEEGRRMNRRVEIKTTGIEFSSQRSTPNGKKGQQLFTRGRALYDKGELEEALTPLEKALTFFKRNQDQDGQRAAAGTLALIYTELGDQKNAARCGKTHQLNQEAGR